jgi:hypothetical protein
MPTILSRFTPDYSAVRPQTVKELFGLRLARKLNDGDAAAHYAVLAARHSEECLVAAYHRAAAGGAGGIAKRFHNELSRDDGCSDACNPRLKLLALRVERRAVAAAVFYGEQIEYTQVRHLASVGSKALSTAVGFTNWLVEQFSPDSFAIEVFGDEPEIRRRVLCDAVIEALRDRYLPYWPVRKSDLLMSFGHPPLRSRREVRNIVTRVFPILIGSDGQSFIQDAVAVGLYVQIERLFLF